MKKIDLSKVRKERSRIPKEERETLVTQKGDEMANKQKPEPKELKEKQREISIVVPEQKAEDDNLLRLINKLQSQDKFIKNGMRQQASINTSDYTSCLIDILVEAKLREGEKIRKTSYLEKYIVQGLKKELKDLGIEIK